MHPTDHPKRPRRTPALAAEALETRSLLTGGQGSTFAIVSGAIAKANQPVEVKFTIDPAHFTVPKGKFTLGIDVAGDNSAGKSVKPVILGVQTDSGRVVAGTSHTLFDKSVRSSGTVSSPMTTAVLVPITLSGKKHDGPVTYTVVVEGGAGLTGKFVLGDYLPGDVNGDGVVDQTDINAIKGMINVNSSSTNYKFDADANRNGRIDASDLRIAKANVGVKTTISPVVASNIDPLDVNGVQDRTTKKPSVHFTGTTSPGAVVTYQNTTTNGAPVKTTSDAKGAYSLTLGLAPGKNAIHVSTLDAFGQSISGNIQPVTYIAPLTTATTATNWTTTTQTNQAGSTVKSK